MYRHGVKFIAEINIFLHNYNMTCMFLSTFRSSELMYFLLYFLRFSCTRNKSLRIELENGYVFASKEENFSYS